MAFFWYSGAFIELDLGALAPIGISVKKPGFFLIPVPFFQPGVDASGPIRRLIRSRVNLAYFSGIQVHSLSLIRAHSRLLEFL